MKKIHCRNKGFTLIETLIAISIFTFSILGLMSILTSSISNTYYAKQKMIGAYLAQEGIEYVRNMRDTYVIYNATSTQVGWDAFKAKLTGTSCDALSGCYFNNQGLNFANHSQQMVLVDTIFACGGTCPKLKFDVASGKYGYSTGEDSAFTRKINATIGVNEVKISSTVSFSQGSGNYTITFSESLYNWIE